QPQLLLNAPAAAALTRTEDLDRTIGHDFKVDFTVTTFATDRPYAAKRPSPEGYASGNPTARKSSRCILCGKMTTAKIKARSCCTDPVVGRIRNKMMKWLIAIRQTSSDSLKHRIKGCGVPRTLSKSDYLRCIHVRPHPWHCSLHALAPPR